MPEDVFTPSTAVFATDQMVRDWLRKPFKPEQIGKLPATPKRPALDFVGHAAVTDRLNKIAPDWSYTVDTMSELNGKVWIRGTMTIGGVSRPEFGDGDDPKEAIGNFIRRGAMRFGVAIDLWSREELESSGAEPKPRGLAPHRAGGTSQVPDSTSPAAGPQRGVATSGAPSALAPEGTLAGGTQSAVGEAAGGGTGGGSQTSPGATKYPLRPEDCDHKTKTGRWLPARQVGGVPVCPRCGLSAVIYRESAA